MRKAIYLKFMSKLNQTIRDHKRKNSEIVSPERSSDQQISKKSLLDQQENIEVDKAVVMDGENASLKRIEEMFSELQFNITQMNKKLVTFVEKIEKDLKVFRERQDGLEVELNVVRQILLSKTFVITGLPPKHEDSDAFEIVRKLSKIISAAPASASRKASGSASPKASGSVPAKEIKLEEGDFKYLKIVNTKDSKSSLIFGEFWEERKKAEFHKAYRTKSKAKPIVAENLFTGILKTENQQKLVHFRTQYTMQTKNLMDLTRAQKTLFEFVWLRDGKVVACPHKTEAVPKPRWVTIDSPKHLTAITADLSAE